MTFSSQLRRAGWWAIFGCTVLQGVAVLLTIVVSDLVDDANRWAEEGTLDASIVLTSLARAGNHAVIALTVSTVVFFVASALLMRAATVVARRELSTPPEDERIHEGLDRLMGSIALLKQQIAAGRRELESAEEEKARVAALLSTSREQLAAIENTLAPGARRGTWLAVAGLALGVVLFLLDRVLSGGS